MKNMTAWEKIKAAHDTGTAVQLSEAEVKELYGDIVEALTSLAEKRDL